MPRHPDFDKIYRAFMKRYCGGPSTECQKGKRFYYGWLKKLGLDDTKPYGWLKPYDRSGEAFRWAEPTIRFWREEEGARLYKCEALFPLTSMNRNIYLEDELHRATRTLIGKVVNLNHSDHILKGISIIDGEFEDGAVECILRVPMEEACPKGYKIVDMLDHSPEVPEKYHIHHVSIEASCLRGLDQLNGDQVCKGLIFTGLALLMRDVLPGVPLTRIMPVERLVENFTLQEEEEMEEEKEEKTETEEKAVAGHETPKAPEDRAWDADAAETRIRSWAGGPDKENVDWAKYQQAFAWYDEEAPENYGSYKLPHHDIVDGRLCVIWRGVAAAMQVLMGARGGVDIPSMERRGVYSHLKGHYGQFDKEPPEYSEVLSGILESKIDVLMGEVQRLSEALREREEEAGHGEELEEEEEEREEATGEETTEPVEEQPPEEEQGESEEPEEEKPGVPTKEELIERYKDLRGRGYSQRDAWRLVALETLEKAKA